MMQLPHKIYFYLIILTLLFLFIWLSFKNNLQLSISRENSPSNFTNHSSSTFKENLSSNFTNHSSSTSVPTIARVLYLFLCENQAEINEYTKAYPSVTADVMFLCWKKNCRSEHFSKSITLYAAKWSGPASNHQSLVRRDPAFNYIKAQSRVFIINERQLNLTHTTTWTTARNILFERAVAEERRQGWRWSYFIFADGDIQIACPLAQRLLTTNQTYGDEIVIAPHFRSLIKMQQSLLSNIVTDHCFVLFDTFLLTASPAIGVIAGMGVPIIFNGLLTQIVYHIDAMLNAFHRDALPFVLPYCARYDARSWWTSQAILIYRSLCLYGHVIQFNAAHITRQKHRNYPRKGNPWIVDQDMNLVPSSLIPLQTYTKFSRTVSALVLRHYSGWSLGVTSDECRDHHTSLDPATCKSMGYQNKTNS